MTVALATRGLSKDFRGFRAVNGVDLEVEEGEVHAIIGPNGAGKTTLFNLLSGFLAPTGGSVELYGEPIAGRPPSEVARLGLARSFQISSVFPSLGVLENVVVALQALTPHPMRFLEPEAALGRFEPAARHILADVGLEGLEGRRAADLAYGEKRKLEIGLSLALEPRVLLLDEPTAGMGAEDVGRVIELVRRVAAGRTVVLVEHNMGVVSELSDRITVLQYGSVLARGRYDEVRRDPRVVEAYLGEEVAA
jgi:branched-chain amino acid transport system ATP-binding protein